MKQDDAFFEKEARLYSKRYEGFTFNIYEKVYQRRRINVLLQYPAVSAARTILDAGCGSGDLLLAIRRRNPTAKLTGFDLSKSLAGIAQAKRLADTSISVGSVTAITSPADAFDLVCCIGVLPYVDEIDTALRELRRVLKPDGVCLVTYPYKNPVVNFLRENALGKWIKRVVLKMAYFKVALDIPQFEAHCRQNGFIITGSRKLPLSEILYELKKTATGS